MIVEFQNGLRATQAHEATQVVIRDLFGSPLSVVFEQQPGAYTMAHRGDPEFPAVLRAMGLADLVVTEHIASPQPRSLVLPNGVS